MMEPMYKMIENHESLFELFASSKDLTCVYDQHAFFSVQARNFVYPKLTLCYHQSKDVQLSMEAYFQAVEKQEASPYIIFPDDENAKGIISQLEKNGFRAIETWTSMRISLNRLPEVMPTDLQIVRVEHEIQLEQWLMVAASVFFNHASIEKGLFEALITNEKLVLWLGYHEHQPVCTAMSLVRSDHVGLYMIATLPDFRGLGFAADITLKALCNAASQGISYGVLQATRAGLNMYRKIGFEEDGKFLIFWKVAKQYL